MASRTCTGAAALRRHPGDVTSDCGLHHALPDRRACGPRLAVKVDQNCFQHDVCSLPPKSALIKLSTLGATGILGRASVKQVRPAPGSGRAMAYYRQHFDLRLSPRRTLT